MGNKNTTTLINNTDRVMEIRVFRGLIAGEGEKYVIKARQQTDIDGTKYDEGNSLMIFCDGRSLLDSSGELVLPAEKFFSFKTVTIGQSPEDQNSTGVVNYEVKLEPPRGSSVNAKTLKVMTLDPSKLFSSNIVKDPETSLLHMVPNFWPRTFTNFNSKDDLEKTVGVVIDLMVQAKKYNALMVLAKEYSADRSTGEVAKEMDKVMEKVKEKVSELNSLCAAKEEWYRPLFQGIRFPPPMAQVDQVKLKNFETAIKDMLQPTPAELLALKKEQLDESQD